MPRRCWDHDDLFGWQTVGTGGGGGVVWEPKCPIAHPYFPGETLTVLAKLTDDGESVSVRYNPSHPNDGAPDKVVVVARRADIEFDDVLEEPTDTLERWLESKFTAEVSLKARRRSW